MLKAHQNIPALMVIKPSPRVYQSPEISELLNDLKCEDKIKRWNNDMGLVLKNNMFAGDPVQKRLIPRYYLNRYGVNNLYRYEHPEGHRSCYTLMCFDNVGVCLIILDIMSHPEYDRRFGYDTK